MFFMSSSSTIRESQNRSLAISTAEESQYGLSPTPAKSKEQMLKEWEEASERQLTKEQKNQLCWEEEYKKERAWREDHAHEEEGGKVWYG